MSHASAAQAAPLLFLCVHRENYDFLKPLAPQLQGKVTWTQSGTSQCHAALADHVTAAPPPLLQVLVDVSNNLEKNLYPEANAEYLQR